jgi:membrane protease YdiL (CAAX protease family)
MSVLLSNIWAGVILLLGPIAGFAGRRKLRTATPQRKAIYFSNAANLIVLGIVTGAVDLSSGSKALGLISGGNSPRAVLTWSISLGVVCVAIVFTLLVARVRLRQPPKASIIRLLPRSPGEKIGFVVLCLLIAVVEEFLYRGFVLMVLRGWLRSDFLAVSLVSISFALMHGLQDLMAIVSAFIQSVLLSLPVLAVHSLAPSISAHFMVNVFAGLCMLSVLRGLRMSIPDDNSGAVTVST